MFFFDSLFKKKVEKENISHSVSTEASAPEIHYVHTKRDSVGINDLEYKILVLWWIQKKKKGYDKTSNKYPKWFEQNYGIDFNCTMDAYINDGMLSVEENLVTISETGIGISFWRRKRNLSSSLHL